MRDTFGEFLVHRQLPEEDIRLPEKEKKTTGETKFGHACRNRGVLGNYLGGAAKCGFAHASYLRVGRWGEMDSGSEEKTRHSAAG